MFLNFFVGLGGGSESVQRPTFPFPVFPQCENGPPVVLKYRFFPRCLNDFAPRYEEFGRYVFNLWKEEFLDTQTTSPALFSSRGIKEKGVIKALKTHIRSCSKTSENQTHFKVVYSLNQLAYLAIHPDVQRLLVKKMGFVKRIFTWIIDGHFTDYEMYHVLILLKNISLFNSSCREHHLRKKVVSTILDRHVFGIRLCDLIANKTSISENERGKYCKFLLHRANLARAMECVTGLQLLRDSSVQWSSIRKLSEKYVPIDKFVKENLLYFITVDPSPLTLAPMFYRVTSLFAERLREKKIMQTYLRKDILRASSRIFKRFGAIVRKNPQCENTTTYLAEMAYTISVLVCEFGDADFCFEIIFDSFVTCSVDLITNVLPKDNFLRLASLKVYCCLLVYLKDDRHNGGEKGGRREKRRRVLKQIAPFLLHVFPVEKFSELNLSEQGEIVKILVTLVRTWRVYEGMGEMVQIFRQCLNFARIFEHIYSTTSTTLAASKKSKGNRAKNRNRNSTKNPNKNEGNIIRMGADMNSLLSYTPDLFIFMLSTYRVDGGQMLDLLREFVFDRSPVMFKDILLVFHSSPLNVKHKTASLLIALLETYQGPVRRFFGRNGYHHHHVYSFKKLLEWTSNYVAGGSSSGSGGVSVSEVERPFKTTFLLLTGALLKGVLDEKSVEHQDIPSVFEEVNTDSRVYMEKYHMQRVNVCEYCQRYNATSMCSLCKVSHYCGRTCQKTHWKIHRRWCKKKVAKVKKVVQGEKE